MKSSPGTNGFTLVELLVVISIIAILASLLLPALERAQWQARVVVCTSNLRQVSIGYLTYEADTGQFPMRGDPADSYAERAFPESCGRPVGDYISSSVFYCPDREMFEGYKYEAADFPITGYFHWGIHFPQGFATRYPTAYATVPFTWYMAYYPFACDIMRGDLTGFDRDVGNVTDAMERVAHSRSGLYTGSNALRHDGSVEWTLYYYGHRADTGAYYGSNAPGSVCYGSSFFYHVVDPMPFAPPSGPPVQ